MNQRESILHDEIIDRMQRLGRIGPREFQQVMTQDPGLLKDYLISSGIPAEDARVCEITGSMVYLKVLYEGDEKNKTIRIRFIAEDESWA